MLRKYTKSHMTTCRWGEGVCVWEVYSEGEMEGVCMEVVCRHDWETLETLQDQSLLKLCVTNAEYN